MYACISRCGAWMSAGCRCACKGVGIGTTIRIPGRATAAARETWRGIGRCRIASSCGPTGTGLSTQQRHGIGARGEAKSITTVAIFVYISYCVEPRRYMDVIQALMGNDGVVKELIRIGASCRATRPACFTRDMYWVVAAGKRTVGVVRKHTVIATGSRPRCIYAIGRSNRNGLGSGIVRRLIWT